MALIDLWKKDRQEIEKKNIQQVIAFAGDGKLCDDSPASEDLRTYLRTIPSDLLSRYADQCLQGTFQNSGFALQDLGNEIGRRLEESHTLVPKPHAR